MARRPNLTRPSNGGIQHLYRFDNGRGASVIRHSFSYGRDLGLWELAVIRFVGPDIEDFQLDYRTPITDDVMGVLSESDVEAVLDQIEALPAFEQVTSN